MTQSFLKAYLGSMERTSDGKWKLKPIAALPDAVILQLDPTKPPIQDNVLVVSKVNFKSALQEPGMNIEVVYGSTILVLNNEGVIIDTVTNIKAKDSILKQGSMEKRKDAI